MGLCTICQLADATVRKAKDCTASFRQFLQAHDDVLSIIQVSAIAPTRYLIRGTEDHTELAHPTMSLLAPWYTWDIFELSIIKHSCWAPLDIDHEAFVEELANSREGHCDFGCEDITSDDMK